MTRNPSSFLYAMFVKLVVTVFLSLLFNPLAEAAATIAMEAPTPIVSPGDILTLRGKQRFNSGQMNNLPASCIRKTA